MMNGTKFKMYKGGQSIIRFTIKCKVIYFNIKYIVVESLSFAMVQL